MVITAPVDQGPQPAWLDRAAAVAVVLAAATCTVLLLRTDPDARGYGTHEQLGMAACSWPAVYGIPCPTCGATTAASLLVHGRVLAAIATQPFGAAAAAAGLVVAAMALWCLLRRRSLLLIWVQLPRAGIVVGAVVLCLLSWLYKWLAFAPP